MLGIICGIVLGVAFLMLAMKKTRSNMWLMRTTYILIVASTIGFIVDLFHRFH